MTTQPTTAEPALTSTVRQQVLVLYLNNSSLDSSVIGWARHDGTGATSPTTGDGDEPPYTTGIAALLDGWRLFQASQLIPPYPDHEYDASFLKHEFLFEKLLNTTTTTSPT
ncbi:hypothetical protein SSOG_00011 [Streptomyces himastatinicus ATCC 53653]|uniref:Uncharacterized protein n=1 Tax=Streptomyces himastatinicus ATCC 53653 TaxID=457427 RepID=D9WVA1_9ACTN|nr:hypothetical protein [Streptomyces himastatinicus]EFL20299.1 hypothetical protein SSOG_00011 [Streptomyces himastatinicus ATCC 53653]